MRVGGVAHTNIVQDQVKRFEQLLLDLNEIAHYEAIAAELNRVANPEAPVRSRQVLFISFRS